MTFTTHLPLYSPSVSLLSILLVPSLLSSLCSLTFVEGSPLPNAATVQWRTEADDLHRSKGLSKRITSMFPHSGTHSITQNTVHVIAAVIGIVGAGLLMVGFLIYLKKRRRAKKATTATDATDPSTLKSSFVPEFPPNETHHHQYHHHHRREPSSSSNMSQFHVFQSDYYSYEQSSPSQLLIPATQPSCPRKLDQHPPSINDTLHSPPPYKP
ncbi:hypothetical protein [Absidia glauca]|uniref:Mid2 domain-containing protein n=1 Tax=Absidia glauca TaxID=4829 RepID=A0A168MTT7_ABSGL|nr:hypothetical protein [Absidia glauca]